MRVNGYAVQRQHQLAIALADGGEERVPVARPEDLEQRGVGLALAEADAQFKVGRLPLERLEPPGIKADRGANGRDDPLHWEVHVRGVAGEPSGERLGQRDQVVAVGVEFRQHVGGPGDLLLRQLAVAVGVEEVEEQGVDAGAVEPRRGSGAR